MEHVSSALGQAIRFVIDVIDTLAQITFPGTDLPVILIMGGVWGIYFVWRWLLAHIFDMEAKK